MAFRILIKGDILVEHLLHAEFCAEGFVDVAALLSRCPHFTEEEPRI